MEITNPQLQNQTIASSSNVLVAVRIRPLNQTEVTGGVKSCIQVFNKRIVAIKKNGDAGQYLKSQQVCINEYEYDVVFDENSTQQEIYDSTARAFIPKLINGQNVTVFAYGATGAGKTHTMLGDTRSEEVNTSSKGKGALPASTVNHCGIIPNAVKDLFRLISAKISRNMTNQSRALQNEQYSVYLTFLEVYNEQVYDLLEPSGKILAVREDQDKGIVVVAGVTEQLVTSYTQVIELIIQGNKQRKTESTTANALSSRSHAVLQLLIKKTTKLDNGKETLTESKLSMIDLAGSERASATNNRGIRLQEGAKINQSLLALANCINALAENSAASHSLTGSSNSSVASSSNTITTSSTSSSKPLKNVKFRDSKLTHLLKSSLEGNCHLIMIANINPSDQTYEDSHNTLKYANRAKNIKVNPMTLQKEQKEMNWMERETQLRQENHHLKQMIHQFQMNIQELQAFKNYVLTYKRIPGSEESVEGGKTVDHHHHNHHHGDQSMLTKGEPDYDLDMNDVSNDIQESVRQVLSFTTVPIHDSEQYGENSSIGKQDSSDLDLLDSSLSSLSTAQDMISDYLSTSQERSSTSSNDDLRLSSSNEEKRDASKPTEGTTTAKAERTIEEELGEEVIQEFEFNLVNDVNKMIQESNQASDSLQGKEKSEQLETKEQQQREEEEEEENEENMVINNFTQKRRKISENRRKSISITRRKSFIPTFNNRLEEKGEEEEEAEQKTEETAMEVEKPLSNSLETVIEDRPGSTAAPDATSNTEIMNDDDDVSLTLEMPKPSEDPTIATTNRKRRASHLPMPSSLNIQTHSMRRQSICGGGASTSSSSLSSSANVAEKPKIEPTTSSILIQSSSLSSSKVTENDENQGIPTKKTTGKKEKETSNRSTPNISATTSRRGVLSESTTAKTASNISHHNNNNNNHNALIKPVTSGNTVDKSSFIKATTATNNNKENQENPFLAIVSKENHGIDKPKQLEYDDIQIDWLGSSVSISTQVPPPPSPTRRETRRMSMSNRRNSLAKVNAMLDSVSHNVNNMGFSFLPSTTTSTAAIPLPPAPPAAVEPPLTMNHPNPHQVRITTRSMR